MEYAVGGSKETSPNDHVEKVSFLGVQEDVELN